MPYTGFGLNHGSSKITVKVHGPLDRVDINTQEVRSYVKDLLLSVDKILNFPDTCKILAEAICEKFCNGDDKIWVQVDIVASNDVMFGASAEKILT